MYWCDLLSYSFSVILDFFNTAVWELIKNGMCSNIINLFYKHKTISLLTCWYAKFHFFYHFFVEIIFTRFIDDVIFMMLILQFWSLRSIFNSIFPLTYSYKKYTCSNTCAWLMYWHWHKHNLYICFRKKWERTRESEKLT